MYLSNLYLSYFYAKVNAFDPTITGLPEEYQFPKHLSFMKIGISNETSNALLLQNLGVNETFEVDTLENIIKRYKVSLMIMLREKYFVSNSAGAQKHF